MDFDHLVRHMLTERHGSEFYTRCIVEALPYILKRSFPLKIEALRAFFLDVKSFKEGREYTRLFRKHIPPAGKKAVEWLEEDTMITKISIDKSQNQDDFNIQEELKL